MYNEAEKPTIELARSDYAENLLSTPLSGVRGGIGHETLRLRHSRNAEWFASVSGLPLSWLASQPASQSASEQADTSGELTKSVEARATCDVESATCIGCFCASC